MPPKRAFEVSCCLGNKRQRKEQTQAYSAGQLESVLSKQKGARRSKQKSKQAAGYVNKQL